MIIQPNGYKRHYRRCIPEAKGGTFEVVRQWGIFENNTLHRVMRARAVTLCWTSDTMLETSPLGAVTQACRAERSRTSHSLNFTKAMLSLRVYLRSSEHHSQLPQHESLMMLDASGHGRSRK